MDNTDNTDNTDSTSAIMPSIDTSPKNRKKSQKVLYQIKSRESEYEKLSCIHAAEISKLREEVEQLAKNNAELQEYIRRQNDIHLRQMDAVHNLVLDLQTRIFHIDINMPNINGRTLSGKIANENIANDVSMSGVLCQWFHDMKDRRLVIQGVRNSALCNHQAVAGNRFCRVHQAVIWAHAERRLLNTNK